jgi:hypothetical protein
MINNQEKIEIITSKLNNLHGLTISLIENSEICKDKYSLEDELSICNAKKSALLLELSDLGGTWSEGLD